MTAAADARVAELTNERLLRQNVLLNLVGWALPAVGALIAIPIMARTLGASRFGLVVLAWSSVSIFSLFDFGLGRALTRMVAERLARGDESSIAEVVWATSWLLLGVTSLLALAGVITAPLIVDRLLDVPPDLRNEAVGVVRLIAIAIPPLAHGVALRGVLEAGQRFGLINRLRVPLGLATYLGPLIAIPLGLDARIAVGVIVAARIVYWVAHFFVLPAMVPDIMRPRPLTRRTAREVTHVGGWITVSNIVSPIIVQADRIVVAVGFPIATTGWYGATAEVATKQWLFTGALQPVLFSALAAALGPSPERAAELIERASRITLLVLLPAAVILCVLAAPGLRLWMGNAYVPEAATVLRWLAVAVFANALAQVPYAVLQGGVDARGPALIHLAELPLYLVLIVALSHSMGVRGIAIAWFARMTIDGVAMWWLLYRRFAPARGAIVRIGRLAAACLIILAAAAAWGARIG